MPTADDIRDLLRDFGAKRVNLLDDPRLNVIRLRFEYDRFAYSIFDCSYSGLYALARDWIEKQKKSKL